MIWTTVVPFPRTNLSSSKKKKEDMLTVRIYGDLDKAACAC